MVGMEFYVPIEEYEATVAIVKRTGLTILYDRTGFNANREMKVHGTIDQINAFNRGFETDILPLRRSWLQAKWAWFVDLCWKLICGRKSQ